MPRAFELTWNIKQKRWFKKYRGRQYAAPKSCGTSREQSYPAALEWWTAKRAEIDEKERLAAVADRRFEPDYEFSIIPRWEDALRRAVEFSERTGHEDTQNDVRFCSNMLRRLRSLFNDKAASLPDPIAAGYNFHLYDDAYDNVSAACKRIWDDEKLWGDDATAAEASKTLGGNVKAFLSVKRSQAKRGDISAGRYDNLRGALESFETFAGSDTPLNEIGPQLLMSYQAHLLESKGVKTGKKLSAHSARDKLAIVKQFLTWCYEVDALEKLPRVLLTKSKTFSISVPSKKIETLDEKYIATLLAADHERAKLYYLLMLNCGMNAVDIAELLKSEVDWRRGRITRKRSKTNKHESTPEVEYKLWSETFELLKKHRSDHKELALTNEGGLKLRRETIDNSGRLKRTNAIKLVHIRLCKRLKLDCHKLKGFRTTAASKLEEHESFGRYAQYFLGHAPRTVADQSYVKPSQELFDKAIDWLGDQFKMTRKAGRRPK